MAAAGLPPWPRPAAAPLAHPACGAAPAPPARYDPDEIEEEQRERERRNQINRQFNQFVKRVQQDIWERDYGCAPLARLQAWGLGRSSTAAGTALCSQQCGPVAHLRALSAAPPLMLRVRSGLCVGWA